MCKVLVLEDGAMIASGLTYAVGSEGYEAVHAKTVKEAMKLIDGGVFDLGILDM